MKSIKTATVLLLMAVGFTFTAQAQTPAEGSLGVRASLFGQFQIEAPYMLNSTVSIAPTLGFRSVEDIETNFEIGVRPRFYTSTGGSVIPYFTGNLAIDVTNNKIADNKTTDILLGVGYGGEFFINNKFSFSADGNLNLLTGDSATTVYTSARVSATVYF